METSAGRRRARRAAVRGLVAIERGAVLGSALAAVAGTGAERAFVRELISGVLRHRLWLDYQLAPLLRHPLEKADPPVRAALRLAGYEIYHLHTPAPVAGDQYAGLMRDCRVSSAVALVAAIVRRLPLEPRPLPDAAHQPVEHLVLQTSHPAWLVQRWVTRLGAEEARALCQANNQPAPLSLRTNTLRISRDALLQRLRADGLAASPGKLAAQAIVVAGGGDPAAWPAWQEGLMLAQDEAAQLVAGLLGPPPGARVLDAAAAPGGKTTGLAELMENRGAIVACDVSEGRLKLVRDNAARLGVGIINCRTGDFRELSRELEPASHVLVDAPCLGTGTWRRRPDARWNKTPAQLDELVALQRELLEAAARCTAPGGTLVYATCSLEEEENSQQISWFLGQHPEWKVQTATPAIHQPLPPSVPSPITAQGYLQTWPHRHGCDGMFAAALQRPP